MDGVFLLSARRFFCMDAEIDLVERHNRKGLCLKKLKRDETVRYGTRSQTDASRHSDYASLTFLNRGVPGDLYNVFAWQIPAIR